MEKKQLSEAIAILNQGGVVGIPTETVYGLAARMDIPSAVDRVFQEKRRPKDHPLIVHVGEVALLSQYAQEVPSYVNRLVEKCWPGPLTLLVKKTDQVPDSVTAGQDTVAIRMPNHPLTLSLLKTLNVGVVAPSANLFMQVSPTTARHVKEGLGESLYVLDGGPCQVGIESTIVDVRDPHSAVILRPGMVTREGLEEVLSSEGISVRYREEAPSPKVSGDHPKHYSPRKPLILLPHPKLFPELLVKLAKEKGENVGIYFLSFGFSEEFSQVYQELAGYFVLHDMPTQPSAYARALYEALHDADDSRADVIVLEAPPKTSEWIAIWDRISRAVSP